MFSAHDAKQQADGQIGQCALKQTVEALNIGWRLYSAIQKSFNTVCFVQRVCLFICLFFLVSTSSPAKLLWVKN